MLLAFLPDVFSARMRRVERIVVLRHEIIWKVKALRHVDHVPVLAIRECGVRVVLEHLVPDAPQHLSVRAHTRDLVSEGCEDLHVRVNHGLLVVHVLHQATWCTPSCGRRRTCCSLDGLAARGACEGTL